ncbi:hypothetical protein BAUCODRAFT_78450 [Baudoinia panamericana UAMH 10762]|uniref:Radical SAM core domain-containing protein n=1 Tax=Baudoinia panamericana (strain UAMH 10762) TaxID=717646 RepID=M2M7E0_BAUPA|nr:uncharacterized protein BAUCODRAFT_78450 [Baudoinia panamericana UAMH 10762]EMC92231.1 hypothetical protein BAUCODRAFT_78450 [Baudoinia panamericana UAMH 10762]
MASRVTSQGLRRVARQAQCSPSEARRTIASVAATSSAYQEPVPPVHDIYAPPPPPVPSPAQPPSQTARKRSIQEAKPFSDFLTDTFSRQHDYLRISVTERCNLRCLYCMPEEGIQLSPSKELLTSAEIFYLSQLFVNQGVSKIRLTGGEPTVRKDIVPLMQRIGSLRSAGLKELALTTNGITLHRKLDAMVEAGLTGVNISLDTLDRFQFQILTRRSGFDAVMKSIQRVQELNRLGAGIKLKINCVVMRGLNDHQILPFVDMTREQDVEVRFIEYMPFDGNKWSENKMLPYADMLNVIRSKYPDISRLKGARNDTSKTWQVPGFTGRVGFITSMTHNFCGTCNRLRITSDGNLKVCLHGDDEVSLRDLLRSDNDGTPMDEEAFEAVRQLELDRRKHGVLRQDGWISKELQLLEVIGSAVKRKKEKHAGIGELENMKNRPMILIVSPFSRWSRVPTPISWSRQELMHRTPTYLLRHPGFVGQSRLFSSTAHTRSPSSDDDVNGKLTHVTSSGEAHMVDVGAKAATKRIAIAVGFVSFSNSEPLQLIMENNNKKGDVLAVARIAGIMAAKRTSDLIPLCHPLAISKVELDVKLLAPNLKLYTWALGMAKTSYEHGAVSVEARVECVGPTGVEMEALCAATGALLTVYDMCKAVDKSMVVSGCHVTYKSGGKSGTWVRYNWASHKGQAWFEQQGLEWVPQQEGKGEKDGKGQSNEKET